MQVNYKQTLSQKYYRQGFTIVELLVVIVTIGILAAITIVGYSGIQQRARDIVLKDDLRNASNQLSMDNVNNGAYPASVIAANNGQGLKASSGTTWQYTYTSVNNSYCITGTNNKSSYFSSTANQMPQAGACPGDVDGGVTNTFTTLTFTSATSAGSRNWQDLASSANGTKLIAGVYGGYLYTSTDSGVTWTQQTAAGSRSWQSLASSADGTKLIAGVYGGYLYTSTDSGVTWTQQMSPGTGAWQTLSSSADGSKVVAGTNGYLYTAVYQ